MLSSMPLCFNIFGSLREKEGFPGLLEAAFGLDIASLETVVCEWVPPRATTGERDLLGDRSAFDAAVIYTTSDGRRCLLGVETKYTEPFSQIAYDKPSYRSVHESCDWFSSDCDVLLRKATNQLFRTMLLAAAADADAGFDEVRVAVLSLTEDQKAERVVKEVRASLKDPNRLVHLTYESLRDLAAASEDQEIVEWSEKFGERYLDPDS